MFRRLFEYVTLAEVGHRIIETKWTNIHKDSKLTIQDIEEQFQSIPLTQHEIIIYSDVNLDECECEKLPIPAHVTSVEYSITDQPLYREYYRRNKLDINYTLHNIKLMNNEMIELAAENKQEKTKWVNKHINFLRKLPDTVTNLVLCSTRSRGDRGFLSDNIFKKIVSNTPKNIISISLPDMLNDGMQSEVIFPNIPAHIAEVNITRASYGSIASGFEYESGYTDEQLKLHLIDLPLSVKFITIMREQDKTVTKQRIDLDAYRNANYFPDTYKNIANEAAKTTAPEGSVLLNQAKAILADYNKSDSWMNAWTVRLFTLHLGRNHNDEVDTLLNDINNGTINTFEGLQVRLDEIREKSILNNNFNPTGSFARRMLYIEQLKEQTQVEDVNYIAESNRMVI